MILDAAAFTVDHSVPSSRFHNTEYTLQMGLAFTFSHEDE